MRTQQDWGKRMDSSISTPDPWMVLWRSVFEWLPWPLFALVRFTEADYYE